MRAAIYYGPEDVRIEDIDTPSPGADEILVRVEAATTCGTDVKTFVRGYWNQKPPSRFGHEFAGEVVEVGARANEGRSLTPITEGMRVAVANSAPCGLCFWCRQGDFSLCADILYLYGAFADYVVVPGRIIRQNVYPLPDRFPAIDACLTEPLSCVVHGIEESGIRVGDTVAINGAGPIGLMFVRLARLKGARVISCDRARPRLEAARAMGAEEAIDVAEVDPVEAVKELTSGHGADVAIEAVGLPEVWETTVAMTRRGGIANLFGGPKQGTRITLDPHRLHYDALTVKSVYHHTPNYIRRALDLIVRREITAADFVSSEFPLGELVYALTLHRDGQLVKAGILPAKDGAHGTDGNGGRS